MSVFNMRPSRLQIILKVRCSEDCLCCINTLIRFPAYQGNIILIFHSVLWANCKLAPSLLEEEEGRGRGDGVYLLLLREKGSEGEEEKLKRTERGLVLGVG